MKHKKKFCEGFNLAAREGFIPSNKKWGLSGSLEKPIGHLRLTVALSFFIYIHCLCVCSSVIHSCQTLYKPMDCSLPGFSVHGISQARILEWVAISFSRASSWPRDQTRFSCFSCTGRWVLYHCNTYCLPILNSLTFGLIIWGLIATLS